MFDTNYQLVLRFKIDPYAPGQWEWTELKLMCESDHPDVSWLGGRDFRFRRDRCLLPKHLDNDIVVYLLDPTEWTLTDVNEAIVRFVEIAERCVGGKEHVDGCVEIRHQE